MGKVPGYIERAARIIDPEKAVGQIKKSYGQQGELQIARYDTFPDNLEEPLWVEIDSLAVPLFIGSFEMQGLSKAIVRFDDFERTEDAELLIGRKLYAENPERVDDDQEESEYAELVGYELTDRISGKSGRVTAFYDYPMNPLLGIEIDGREVLVPLAGPVVEAVDRRRKRMTAALTEGLLELDE